MWRCVFSSNTDCKKKKDCLLFPVIHFPPDKLFPPRAAVCDLFRSPASQTAPRVRSILTNISKNSSRLTSLSQTCISRLAVVRGGGGERAEGRRGFFWKGGGHSCQPLLTANRYPRIHRDSHGSAAPSQWRTETGESGRVRRREENNR